jgi:hypothetical protein
MDDVRARATVSHGREDEIIEATVGGGSVGRKRWRGEHHDSYERVVGKLVVGCEVGWRFRWDVENGVRDRS